MVTNLKGIFVFGLTILLLTGTVTSVFLSCKHDAEGIDQIDTICFETQILPIFLTSCALPGCHITQGEESEYIFTDYIQIMEAITPGKPKESPAYTSLIAVSSEEGLMPPNQPLSEQNRNLIRVWILQGAQNLSCTEPCDTISTMTFADNVWPIIDLNCVSCHSGTTPDAGILLTDYCNIAQLSAAGFIKGALRGGTFVQMPPSGPLSECNIRQVELWIQGDSDTLCTNNPDTTEYSNPRACFQRDILPVLLSSCAIPNAGCHDGTSGEVDYVFTNFTNTRYAVTPGNPSESKLYNVLITGELEDRMPPSPYPALPTAARDSIYNWISYGAPDEYCGEACDTITEPTFSGTVWPIIELNCRGCHSGGSPSGNVLLTKYDDVATYAANGKLTGVLRNGAFVLMPPTGSLSECKIRQVELWVEAFYQNNK